MKFDPVKFGAKTTDRFKKLNSKNQEKREFINMYLLTEKTDEKFATWLERHTSLGEGSIRTYKTIIKTFLKGLEPKVEGSETPIEPPEPGSEDYIEEANLYLRAHLMPCYASAMRYFYQFNRWDPAGLIKGKQRAPRPKDIPKITEVLAVMDTLEPEEKMITRFILNTGCRCNEAFKVRLDDITPEGKVTLQTKGRQYRTVMLPERFRKRLMNYAREVKGILGPEKIFYTESKARPDNKVRMFYRTLNKDSRKVLEKLLGTHDFRRHCAVALYLDSGKDILLVQRVLGHKDIKTTQRYIQYAITEDDILKAAEIMSRRAVPEKEADL